MSLRMLAAIGALAPLMLVAAASASADDAIYRSPVYGWSVVIPEDWIVDDADADDVAFIDPDGIATVSVNVGEVHAADVDDMAADLVTLLTQMAADRGIAYEVLASHPGRLADGTEFVEIEDRVGEGDGGRSIMRLFLAARTATTITGEAAEIDWPDAEEAMTAVVRSFHPGESTVLTAAGRGSPLRLRPLSRGYADGRR